jgi:hypothetical protein
MRGCFQVLRSLLRGSSFFILLLAGTDACFAQKDSIVTKSNFLCVDPISLCFLTLNMNYEHVLAIHHGFFIEGDYAIPLLETSYYSTIGYRYHFHSGTTGPFVGPIAKYGYLANKIQDEDKNTYNYHLKYYAFGAHWGTRWKLWKKFNTTIRIGACYPVSTLTWDKNPPSSIGGIKLSVFTSLFKLPTFLDSELTIFFPF